MLPPPWIFMRARPRDKETGTTLIPFFFTFQLVLLQPRTHTLITDARRFPLPIICEQRVTRDLGSKFLSIARAFGMDGEIFPSL